MSNKLYTHKKEEYLILLRRAAWRMQYVSKQIQKREVKFEDINYFGSISTFENELVSKIFVNEVINTIPNRKCRYVVNKVVIEGYTEKEIAEELKISQQAVNKCKQRALHYLRRNFLNSIN